MRHWPIDAGDVPPHAGWGKVFVHQMADAATAGVIPHGRGNPAPAYGARLPLPRSQQEGTMSDPKERRRYCRIDDGVIFRYRPLSLKDIPEDIEQLDVSPASRFTLTSMFAATSHKMKPLLQSIQQQSLEIAEYLQMLDRKLGLVARAFLMQEINVHEEPPAQVNLSAGGIGFYADTPFPAGALLELEIILLPSYTGIRAYGKVAYRRHDPGGQPGLPYRVGVEFIKIRDQDRDLITRHIEEKGGESQDAFPGDSEAEVENA
ncbi:MAG: PilZ domain-containing protein [Acidiferrobacterales bacterium]